MRLLDIKIRQEITARDQILPSNKDLPGEIIEILPSTQNRTKQRAIIATVLMERKISKMEQLSQGEAQKLEEKILGSRTLTIWKMRSKTDCYTITKKN